MQERTGAAGVEHVAALQVALCKWESARVQPALNMLQQTTGPPSKLVPGMKSPKHGSPAAHHSTGHKSCPRG